MPSVGLPLIRRRKDTTYPRTISQETPTWTSLPPLDLQEMLALRLPRITSDPSQPHTTQLHTLVNAQRYSSRFILHASRPIFHRYLIGRVSCFLIIVCDLTTPSESQTLQKYGVKKNSRENRFQPRENSFPCKTVAGVKNLLHGLSCYALRLTQLDRC